jgi:outer membrane protein assembly factor BamB
MNCRQSTLAVYLCATVWMGACAWAASARCESPLVTYDAAARNGLERAWFAQIPVDPSRSRVTSWYLYYDRLYAVTDSGIVSAINSETGEQLWSKQIGKPGHPAFGPGANSNFLGIVSGGKLYILDRNDGRLEWVRELGSAPSSGPALSNEYAYVSLVTGRIEGYKLTDPAAQPWYYQSKGRTYLKPTTTGQVVSWPTAEGYLYVSRADQPGVLFRLETNDDIVTSPAEMEPYLYIASLDGYLYAVHEMTGREKWRYSTGYSIHSSPAVVGKQVYVASFEPALHCLNADTGSELWSVLGVSHFAAQGKQRVYASDRYGNLLVMDSKTGNPIGRLNVGEGLSTLVNDQTDRLFLVNDVGLVQCLHEIGADQPTQYRHPPAPAATEGTATPPPTASEDSAAPTAEAEAAEAPPEEGEEALMDEAPADEAPAEDAETPPPADVENPFE